MKNTETKNCTHIVGVIDTKDGYELIYLKKELAGAWGVGFKYCPKCGKKISG